MVTAIVVEVGADGSAGVLGGEDSRDVSIDEGTIKTPIPVMSSLLVFLFGVV